MGMGQTHDLVQLHFQSKSSQEGLVAKTEKECRESSGQRETPTPEVTTASFSAHTGDQTIRRCIVIDTINKLLMHYSGVIICTQVLLPGSPSKTNSIY